VYTVGWVDFFKNILNKILPGDAWIFLQKYEKLQNLFFGQLAFIGKDIDFWVIHYIKGRCHEMVGETSPRSSSLGINKCFQAPFFHMKIGRFKAMLHM
jgi:hypothetical protein